MDATEKRLLWPDFVFAQSLQNVLCTFLIISVLTVRTTFRLLWREFFLKGYLVNLSSLPWHPQPPEQNGSWSFSIASDLKGSWGGFQRNSLSFQNYKKKLQKNTPAAFLSYSWPVFISYLFFGEWGDFGGGVPANCVIPPAAAQEGGCLPGPQPPRAIEQYPEV